VGEPRARRRVDPRRHVTRYPDRRPQADPVHRQEGHDRTHRPSGYQGISSMVVGAMFERIARVVEEIGRDRVGSESCRLESWPWQLPQPPSANARAARSEDCVLADRRTTTAGNAFLGMVAAMCMANSKE